MHANLEVLVLGSLEVVRLLVDSLDPWEEDSLAGMEDTLLDMPYHMVMGLMLGILLELEDTLGQVGGMQEGSLVQHWRGSLDDLGGSLAEVVDIVVGLQEDIQG